LIRSAAALKLGLYVAKAGRRNRSLLIANQTRFVFLVSALAAGVGKLSKALGDGCPSMRPAKAVRSRIEELSRQLVSRRQRHPSEIVNSLEEGTVD
jgi:hypothetical protein